MSEMIERQEALIPRETPVVNIKLGERAIGLTYDNTFLYTFGHGYKAMDHIYIKDTTIEPPVSSYVWRDKNPELFEKLFLAEFQSLRAPFPPDCDVSEYEKREARCLDEELKGVL